jgi:enoyl-CoA hydratase/carnithine racemase
LEKRLTPSAMSEPEVLCDVSGSVAIITLNRPAALNALSLGMLNELQALFRRLAEDDGIRAILLRGAGEKAFCAGGDIRALYQSFKSSGSLHQDFFVAEYALDYLLYDYPKPCLALLDGITMGGGMGLAQSSPLRIVGERTRIAMPEVGIGLFPDVGASHFLSRLPGSVGMYLALTGVPVRGSDALYVGLADAYLAPSAVDSLAGRLTALSWSDDWLADVTALIHAVSAHTPPPSSLSVLRPAIDEHFSRPSVAAILASLEAETHATRATWAQQTAALMRSRSPTMLSVAHRQLGLGRSMSVADCFRMELGMVRQCFTQGDFIEGVRALLIDKDNAPLWRPARLEEVSEASVAAFFDDPWRETLHPLAGLEATALHRAPHQAPH